MAHLVVALACFAVAAVVLLLAALTGHRGQVCERGIGYRVPARVESDPRLSGRANELVARWCTCGAVLAVLPLVPLTWAVSRGTDEAPLSALVGLAAYGLLVTVVAAYPFERIEHLGDDARSR